MGGSHSKPSPPKEKPDFLKTVRSNIEEEIARRLMIQREVQMAVNVARARDNLQIFGSAWLTLVTATGTAHVMGRPPPGLVGVPIVVGALMLGNLADMAYGNKLLRVTKEAEYLLSQDRGRFVPMQQAPFFHMYTDKEKAAYYHQATAVGELWPSRWIAGNREEK